MPYGKGTYGSKVGRPKKKKEYIKGGKTNGPSHAKGGIPIEVEGGEYIIKKSSVNAETQPILEKINKTGKLSYACGGKIPVVDARKRKGGK